MNKYEFHAYPGLDDGKLCFSPEVSIIEAKTDASARSKAGRMAVVIHGPVDIAWVDDENSWDDRYITTASPSTYHVSGYKFERVE